MCAFVFDQWQNMQCSFKYFEQCITCIYIYGIFIFAHTLVYAK